MYISSIVLEKGGGRREKEGLGKKVRRYRGIEGAREGNEELKHKRKARERMDEVE